MPDPDTVKRALAALAGERELSERDRRTIDEASAAIRDVERGATFVTGGGEERLRGAIAAARRGGDTEYERRGQRALAALAWFRRAANSDHFCSAHATTLSEESKPGDI